MKLYLIKLNFKILKLKSFLIYFMKQIKNIIKKNLVKEKLISE